MDIYQTVISHYPHWSKIELIAVVIVMIISFIILDRFYKKDKINIFMTGLGVEKPDDHDYDLIVNSDYIDLKEDAKKIFTDVGEYKKEKKINHIMTNVYLILLYAVYAIFLIPLILIFI